MNNLTKTWASKLYVINDKNLCISILIDITVFRFLTRESQKSSHIFFNFELFQWEILFVFDYLQWEILFVFDYLQWEILFVFDYLQCLTVQI